MPSQPYLLDVARYDPEGRYRLTREEAARLLGVTARSLNNWQRDRGFPHADRSTRLLDLREVGAWCGRQISGQWSGAITESGRERKARAEAELKELELARQKREVIDADEVRTIVVAATADMRNSLLTLGRSLAPQVASESDTAAIERLITARVEDTLSRLSDRWADLAGDEEPPDDL